MTRRYCRKTPEKKSRVGDVAQIAKGAEHEVEEWLAVLALCFQPQDGLAAPELDRVHGSGPDELDRHRAAIQGGVQYVRVSSPQAPTAFSPERMRAQRPPKSCYTCSNREKLCARSTKWGPM